MRLKTFLFVLLVVVVMLVLLCESKEQKRTRHRKGNKAAKNKNSPARPKNGERVRPTSKSATSSKRRRKVTPAPISSANNMPITTNNNKKKKKAKPARALDPDTFLEKFGYLQHLPTGGQHDHGSRKRAIKRFQRMAGVKATGNIDEATLKKIAAPRCGMPDLVPETVTIPPGVSHDAPDKPESYYVPGYKWTKKQLSWRAENYSPDLNSGTQRGALTQALKYWSDVSSLDFREVSGDADIMIKFTRGDHGDGSSFDGPGMTLAHAFYPENGDTHFDEDEYWTEDTEEGTNLRIVAAHEFGHALGLGHSSVQESLMAPYYQGYSEDFSLHDDDIRAIQSLYGGNSQPATPPPTRPTTTTRRPESGRPQTTPKTSGRPDDCTTKFDAILQAHDYRIYVFREKWMWRLTDHGKESEFPRQAKKYYEKAPSNVGAAVYSWRTHYTYMFKSNRVWVYYGFSFVQKKTISTKGYPSGPHSALMARDGKVYLLKGAGYWEFDERTLDITDPQERPIQSMWPGIPPNIEAAVRLTDGYIYFIKGGKYRKYNEYYRRVESGYPKDKAVPWMGAICSDSGRTEPK